VASALFLRDIYLAVAGAETGDKDLICAGVEGATPATTREVTPATATTITTTATTTAARLTEGGDTLTARTTAPKPAGTHQIPFTAGKSRELAAASPAVDLITPHITGEAVPTRPDEASPAPGPAKSATPGAAQAVGPAGPADPAVSASSSAAAGAWQAGTSTIATATARDDQRGVAGTDHERATATATTTTTLKCSPVLAAAADRDFELFAGGQGEVAADLRTETAGGGSRRNASPDTTRPPLSAERNNLIYARPWHLKGNDFTSAGKALVNERGVCGRCRCN
jgi:hypothetical protein